MAIRLKNKFTLVEFLILVSIFALLGSLLQPSFIRILAHSKSTDCMSHLSKIAVALQLYTEDFDQYLPVTSMGPAGDPQWGSMAWALELSYLLLPQSDPNNYYTLKTQNTVLGCPSFEHQNVEAVYGGYGHNFRYMGYYDGSDWGPRTKITDTNLPRESLIIADSIEFTTESVIPNESYSKFSWQTGYLYPPTNDYYARYFEYRRHFDGTNISWLDGHASNLLWEELKLGKKNDPEWYFKQSK